MVRRIVLFALTALLAAAPAHAAQELLLHTDALRVEKPQGESVLVLSNFSAETDQYVLQATGGRYTKKTEIMDARGSADAPATLTKSGETPFTVSAERQILIHFQDEILKAEGNVEYSSDDVQATCRTLTVDHPDAIGPRIDELSSGLSEEVRTMVEAFMSGIKADGRLILLEGDVHLVQNDSTLDAAWMLLDESQQDHFISVADPDKQLTLKLTVEDSQN